MIYTSTIGFPRIGEKRELKKAVENFWEGAISEDELFKLSTSIKKRNYLIQKENNIDIIPSNDFSFYDTILDHSIMLGQIPERYLEYGSPLSLGVYFAMARGKDSTPPLEMTKWFDTNYHFIVPELIKEFKLTFNRPLKEYIWAKEEAGIKTKPIVPGIYTYLKLAKIKDDSIFREKLNELAPCYAEILGELSKSNVEWIQIDEPALIFGGDKEIVKLTGEIYKGISMVKGNSKWILQTYYEDIQEHLEEVINWPFDYIGIDLVRGKKTLSSLKNIKFPENKKLALGLVDGRNIWRSNFIQISEILKEIDSMGLLGEAIIQPSSSLMHIPYSLKNENSIPMEIKNFLAFAEDRLKELDCIKEALLAKKNLSKEGESGSYNPQKAKYSTVRERLRNINESSFKRGRPFSERKILQQRRLNLPELPVTTIGSFPQTDELRKIRAKWKSKKITNKDYKDFIKKEITNVIRLQEEIGLDVLVHGEFERSDMVEFFGEKLKGFFFTKNGWVQSYGTRCVKPPIIYSDVERTQPMTVDEILFAQALTGKTVKGMLTGPITILNWSFPRLDVPREEVVYQIALALRDETLDLERNGIKIIQIDEPAFREGLPLKHSKREEYLKWAVKAFRLCSSGVKDETQIHTHMCYSEFNEIIREIYELDADVISMENARSSDELLSVFKIFNYDHFIGPGVYDIHSERIPSVEEIESKIRKIANHIRKELLWINPDCGLKTRNYREVIQSLKNMITATKNLRGKL